MEATVRKRRTTHPITKYWSMVKDLDDTQKLELVTMLIESVKHTVSEPQEPKKKLNACDYAGIWSDKEYMDADELVKHLKESRHFKDRTEFWANL